MLPPPFNEGANRPSYHKVTIAMEVLVVEDDQFYQTTFREILSFHGFTPVTAYDGYEALNILSQEQAPQLMILDWNLPHLNGLDVCKCLRLKMLNDSIYIVIVTAEDHNSKIVQGLENGANDYIRKPFNQSELLARLEVGRRTIDIQEELKSQIRTLTEENRYDYLTKVLNRKSTMTSLHQELSRCERKGSILHIAVCDIDHFKRVNDTHGHFVGDEVLVSFADLVKSTLRPYDIFGRIGGEEFIIGAIIPEDSAFAFFERMRKTVALTALSTSRGRCHITMSMGITQCHTTKELDKALLRADEALYEAKNNGRNTVSLATSAD